MVVEGVGVGGKWSKLFPSAVSEIRESPCEEGRENSGHI